MGWVALVAEGVFVVVAIPLRVRAQRRWTGSSGVTLDWGSSTPVDVAVAGVLAGAVVALGVGTLLAVLGVGIPAGDPGGVIALGAALSGVGVAVTVYAQLTMGASWRIGVDAATPTELVTSGPFRLVRNPIYTAMVCFVVGIAVLLRSPVSVVALVLLIAGLELQVRMVEEPFLAGQHGDRYLTWSRRTGRFVPWVGRLGRVGIAVHGYGGSPGTAPPISRPTSPREAPRAEQRGG
jgi:protein-S-isoprenylcysteine O-methyltransferase Ste14